MLVVLVSNSGRLLTKDELMLAVWTDAVVEENNLDKTISALRKALGGNGSEQIDRDRARAWLPLQRTRD